MSSKDEEDVLFKLFGELERITRLFEEHDRPAQAETARLLLSELDQPRQGTTNVDAS